MMKRRFFRHMAVVVLAGMALLAAAQTSAPTTRPATDKCCFWKVTGPGATVYLFGSMHMATKDMYPLPQEVEKAYAQAKYLAVELDPTKVDPMAVMKLVQEKGMYGPGDTLTKHLSKETNEELAAFCKAKGLPEGMFQQFKPWMAGLTVAMLGLQAIGMDEKLGLEYHFIEADKGKPVRSLETMDFQVTMLAGFPEELQEAWLRMSLQQDKTLQQKLAELKQAWLDGDGQKLDAVANEALKEKPEFAPLMKKLIDDRNDTMTEKVVGFLKDAEKTNDPGFVVLGAMHMVGERGIVRQLEKKGYKVEQVKVTKRAGERAD